MMVVVLAMIALLAFHAAGIDFEEHPDADSLRARIYAQYAYIASTRHDPRERARLERKASSLYP